MLAHRRMRLLPKNRDLDGWTPYAWLIYLVDRLADASSLRTGLPRSLRQQFCRAHREIWVSGLLLIGGFDLYVIRWSTSTGTFFVGLSLAF